jgi:hypothetical protein
MTRLFSENDLSLSVPWKARVWVSGCMDAFMSAMYPAGLKYFWVGDLLYCQFCGTSIDGELCRSCGKIQPAFSPAVRGLAATYATRPDLVGVDGWLLLFCVALTAPHPFSCLYVAIEALRNAITVHRIALFTVARLLFVTTFYSGLAVYSIATGLRLWRRRPGAVQFAKNYLLIATISVLGLQSIFYLQGLQVELPKIFFRRILYFLVWYSYLLTSRRVKYTYLQG